jgi:diguanylate cyclase (GGDEF)-like protein
MTKQIAQFHPIENQLTVIAKHDLLTGLDNRAQFQEKLSDAIARSCRSKMVLAVLFIDIDYSKTTDSELTRLDKEQVLREFAQRLKDCLRQTDTAARWSDSEFAVILEGMHAAEEATVVARKILWKANDVIEISDIACKAAANIGIAIRPETQTDPEALLHKAEEALYMAKATGRNTYQLVH